ncbi:p21-activated protein kinase-interacting protein 1-like [Hondaea fermentalgiana]|uniref:p21-activated protein kinase-interacting protein 1-like n=1 Tax=Hondaea fermentalgiana TaxID=2315210 RepID=A0A2R5G0G5_9STRA|nr:p21-activated protein kinase-interacting protein 1-like [Hondaea fermentalgiana]|eukprot:GBG24015.1 p21-activated protein kinase-interacting protein 1-like [Hondaea fermentalgiana]
MADAESAVEGLAVVAGCYDGTLHGWRDEKLAFAYQAQYGCIKAMAVSDVSLSKANVRGNRVLLAMGGTAEAVHTYDLAGQRELVQLEEHENTITALCFVGNSFLLSGGEDGKLCVWDCKDWALMTVLKGHKPGPVTSVAAHPIGKVALSTSRDNSLRMWNLETARPASRNRLEKYKTLDQACWSATGDQYAVVADDRVVLVFRIEDTSGQPYRVIEPGCRVNALTLATPAGEVVLGLEDGRVLVYTAEAESAPLEMQCEKRVRSVYAVHCSRDGTALAKLDTVYAALSNGAIEIWNGLASQKPEKSDQELRLGASAHLTCMVACPLGAQAIAVTSASKAAKKKAKKQKHKQQKVHTETAKESEAKHTKAKGQGKQKQGNGAKRARPGRQEKEQQRNSPGASKRQRSKKR